MDAVERELVTFAQRLVAIRSLSKRSEKSPSSWRRAVVWLLSRVGRRRAEEAEHALAERCERRVGGHAPGSDLLAGGV